MRNRNYSQQLAIAAHQHIKERDFWLKTMAGDLIKSKFPPDFDGVHRKQKKQGKETYDNVKFTFPAKLFHRLMELSTGSDSRLHMILAASLVLLLEKYTNNKDIIIGTPIYKQPGEGEFINTTLALRNRLESCWTFKHLILQIRETIVKAVEHQDYPIEVLLEQLKISQPGDGFPLLDAAIMLENIHERKYLQHLPINIIFTFKRLQEDLEGTVEYNRSLYEKENINRIVSHYMNLCQDVLFKLDMPISRADMLAEEEKKQLLIEFNHTDSHFPADKPIYQLFREQVDKTPDNIALLGPTQMKYRTYMTYMTYITYRELNEKSNQLAHLLKTKGVHPDTIVGIMMEPSLDTIIGILGILKAGGAYLPIDATFPQKRIVSMLKDSNASLLLTKEKFIKKFSFISIQGLRESQNEPMVTAPRAQVQNLDSLQIPDRSMVDYEKYHPYIGQAMMKNDITLQFSRGCTYNCAYCFKIWPNKYIIRSAENMFEEILFYYKMGVRRFAFVDDLPNINVKISSKLYQLIIKNRLKVHLHYVNGIRGDILTKEYIDLMIEAGTVVMDLALETTSPRLQKLIRKNLNLERLHENICYILGKYPHVILETAILHGIPTETREEATASLEYIKRLKWIHFPYIHLLKIYPNTDMARIALEYGVSKEAIESSAELAYHEIPETLPFSKNFTRKYQSEFLSDYFLSKERLLKVLPAQMQVFTEAELVQAYDGYLPVKINSFPHLLDYIGISRNELKGEFLPDDFGDVPDFNRKLKANFPPRSSEKNALRILLLDLSQYFTGTLEEKMIYDVVEPPLGLMYLLTHLHRTLGNRIKGKIAKSRIDFDSFDELKEVVEDFQPHVIGVRSLNFYRDFFHEAISLLRQWGIKVPIIAGGPYATSSFHTMLQDHHIDLAVIGEGEITLAEITAKILENHGKLPDVTTLKTIPGIAFIENKTKLVQKRINREILLLDRLPGILSHQPTALTGHENINHSNDLAYIIYTSGSTGTPKGVMISHNNLVNQVTGLMKTFGFDASLNYILLASFTFDVSVMHIFLPFITGAKLFFPGEEIRKDPIKLWQSIAKNKISVLNIVPAFMKAILENIEERDFHLKYLFVGGDVFQVDLYRSLKETFNAEKIINIYGPTETTINATLYECKQSSGTPGPTIPIGKPVKNYKVYILDSDLNPVPIGISGELCIAGAGVARGYLNNPELTSEKFIEHMSYRSYRSYIYRTGDLTRWLPDGNIEFLGRIDQQVKIRGFRIEPGEIEKYLLTHEAVKEAVVIPKEDKAGNKDLCAYFVAKPITQPELWPSVGEYFIWDELMYYAMTHDERRNKSFKVAINRLVKNKTVVEVGTGQDAVLARFCVEAGAKKVYAIEIIEEYCRKAKQTVKELGAAGKIIIIPGDVRDVELTEKVDVCLANQCGTIGSSEGAIILHNHARRFLKEEGVVIPHRCITRTAAISLPENLHQNPGFTELPASYVEKIFKKFNTPFDLRLCVKNFPKENIISDTGIFEDLHLWEMAAEENTSRINLTIKKDARLDGFLMWLNLYTMEDELIDTLAKEYVWLPVYIPVFYPGIEVSKGDVIKAEGMTYLSDNHFSPDYKIKGVLAKTNGNDHEFEYEFPRFGKIVNGKSRSAFYRKIINIDDPRIRILKNRKQQPDAAELRKYLADKLPDYMVPSHFVRLEKIPLTTSGKLDKQGLPAHETRTQGAYTAPRNPVEETLVKLWSEVLGIEKTAIGIDNNFFESGGHSLKATIVLSKIHKQLDARIPMVELFKTPTIRGLSRYLHKSSKGKHTPINPAEKKEYYALSSAQKRLYILQQMDPENIVYNLPAIMALEGNPGKKKLKQAFKKLIQQHESLRTSFHMKEGQPAQRVHDQVEFEIEYYQVEVKVKVEEEQSSRLEGTRGLAPLPEEPATRNPQPATALISSFIRHFDLSKAPLVRVGLIKTGKQQHILMVDMHHIITDGTSLGVLVKEFMALYAGEELSSLRIQFKDFAHWQDNQKQREKVKKQEAYWLNQFRNEIPVLDLPTDYSRPVVQSFEGRMSIFKLGKKETGRLKTRAAKEGATTFMVLLAIFNILLAKLSGQEDIVIGSPIAGRRHADLQKIIGMFVNTLALRNHPVKEKSIKEFIHEVKEGTLAAFENQEYPFENLVEQAMVNRDISRNPLFDIMLVLGNMELPQVKIPGLLLKPYDQESTVSRFDLTLSAVEVDDNLVFTLEYCTKLYKQETIQQLINYFKKITSSVLENPGKKLAEIEIISREEKTRILYDFNNTRVEYPKDKTIHQMFAGQADQIPDNIAVVAPMQIKNRTYMTYTTYITYRELNQKSNQLARVLKQKGIKPDTTVGIMLERSTEMIIGIYGILKAGAAYLPIDPHYPEERIEFMLKDSKAKILLAAPDLTSAFEPSLSTLTSTSTCQVNPTNLAYIIYTSGSTGKPKGVMIGHQSLTNILHVLQEKYPFSHDDVYLMKTSYIFDVSTAEIFGWIFRGGRLVILEKDGEKDPARILDTIEMARVTHINFVPSMFNAFLSVLNPQNIDKLSRLKYLFLAGEQISAEVISKLRNLDTNKDLVVENLYGPTEATIYASAYSLRLWDGHAHIPIGKALANVQLYILSKEGHFQPINVPGELCIAGAGLSRGYLNQPELTAEKFCLRRPGALFEKTAPGPHKNFLLEVQDKDYMQSCNHASMQLSSHHSPHLPITPSTHYPIYQTGDLARWLQDGNIEFLGRIDHQVKIRGYRIELGEIESRLLENEFVKETAVIAREDENKTGDRYLCAYIVYEKPTAPGKTNQSSQLKKYLSHSLPAYMIPSFFVPVDKIPLTASGKVDRKALARINAAPTREVVDVEPPRSEMEKLIDRIWAEVLNIEKISIEDDFFSLGGNSLNIIQLQLKLKEVLVTDIPVAALFRYSTIRSLALYLNEGYKKMDEDFYNKKKKRTTQVNRGKQRKKQKIKKRLTNRGDR